MTPTERALVWRCGADRLLGVLAEPPVGAGHAETGVVIVVGGPQVRTGSHRQFTRLARKLAIAGHPVLRFDCRGMGDSEGDPPGFQHIGDDLASAIDALQAEASAVRRVVLWGLCDGASAALMYLADNADPRVAGLCLVNPWVRSQQSQARTRVRHYYTQRLRDPAFWAKLLRGGVAWQALRGLFDSLRQSRQATPAAAASAASAAKAPSFQSRMLQGWMQQPRPVLLLLSENDLTAQEFGEYVAAHPEWQAALQRPGVTQQTLAGQDHTFSSAEGQALVETLTQRWLHNLAAQPAPAQPERVAAHV